MKQIEKQIIDIIGRSSSILIMPSSPPDGDSLGSALALYLVLRQQGKAVTVVCADPIPDVYKFLPMMQNIESDVSLSPDFVITLDCKHAKLDSIHSMVENDKINIILTAKKGQFSAKNVNFEHGPSRYDLIITVDTAATTQLGRFYEDNVELFSNTAVINIDHHASNEQFGRINYVDVMSSSTTEMILGILESMEEESGKELVDEEIATLLLAGIITDTGSFQNSNTTPRSFSNSAKLIRRGAKQQDIIQHVYKTKHLSTLRLWGRILSNIRVDKEHRFLWSKISAKDMAETGSKSDESGSIIDELMTNAPDVDIVLLLKEKEGSMLSGSMRTVSEAIDASEIAGFFGGGGHAKAAGFKVTLSGDFQSKCDEIVDRIKQWQAARLGLDKVADQGKFPQTEKVIAIPEKGKTVDTESQKEAVPEKETAAKYLKSTAKKDRQEISPGIYYKFEE